MFKETLQNYSSTRKRYMLTEENQVFKVEYALSSNNLKEFSLLQIDFAVKSLISEELAVERVDVGFSNSDRNFSVEVNQNIDKNTPLKLSHKIFIGRNDDGLKVMGLTLVFAGEDKKVYFDIKINHEEEKVLHVDKNAESPVNVQLPSKIVLGAGQEYVLKHFSETKYSIN